MKTKMSTVTLLFNTVLEVLATAIREEKINKSSVGKKKSKTVIVCKWHDTIPRKSYRCHKKITRATMNLVKLQDTKLIHRYVLLPYALTAKDQKYKLRKQSNLSLHKKNKIPKNKPTYGGKRSVLRKL